MNKEIDLQLIFESKKDSNNFLKNESKIKKLSHLLSGEMTLAKMINNETLEEYIRPKLNGIIVLDENNESIFKTQEEAYNLGNRIK